jgi:hypothetical protein
MKTDHSPTFPTGILHFPIVAPPDLILVPQSDYYIINHIDLHQEKGSYRERFLTTRLLLIAYTTKHSKLSLSFLS